MNGYSVAGYIQDTLVNDDTITGKELVYIIALEEATNDLYVLKMKLIFGNPPVYIYIYIYIVPHILYIIYRNDEKENYRYIIEYRTLVKKNLAINKEIFLEVRRDSQYIDALDTGKGSINTYQIFIGATSTYTVGGTILPNLWFASFDTGKNITEMLYEDYSTMPEYCKAVVIDYYHQLGT